RGGLRCGSDGPDAPGHAPRRREPLSGPAPADLAGTCLLPITGARGSPPARLVDPTSTLDAQPRKRPAPNTHRPEDAPGGCPTPRYPIRGGHLMIRFEEVTFHYAGVEEPALREVTLTVEEGELCLVTGRTGVGKSTLLNAVNGLVPRFTGGNLQGRVTVAEQSTASRPPQEFAHLVGVVGQDPLAGFVTDTVEEELAYSMEQLAVPPDIMRKRVEETLDLLGIAELRHRAMRTLSGGQQQRVAIGAVLTPHPRILVLDEPTSALDPTAAEDVLADLIRLVHDLGTTVLVAEHRMERVLQYADRLVHLPGDGRVVHGDPTRLMTDADVAPPVVRLGRLAGWERLPLSVRDARRRAASLRERLAESPVPDPPMSRGETEPTLSARRIVVRYGNTIAVREVDLDLHPGEVVALMGRNGSGKSSL